MVLAGAAAAATVAAATYLDGKYQLSQEVKQLLKSKQVERSYTQAVEQRRISPYYLISQICAKQPNLQAIWTREATWTFGELHDQILRYAQWMLDEGVRPGELVGIYLQNCAEYFMVMFATLAIGAGPAFVNYNLEGKALMHCLAVANTKLLIVDTEAGCQERINGSRADIEAAGTKLVNLDAALKRQVASKAAVVPPDSLREGMTGDMPCMLIYTSGTTGLPKGCAFTIARMWSSGGHLGPSFGAKAGKDCWYCPMPLYHGTGSVTSTFALLGGISVAIAPRFSVKNFWPDVHDSNATMFVYVGETARYLLAAPSHPLERKHKLRLAYGNGLRPDVWGKLQQRFGIPEVAEFFNSSEGMLGLMVWSRNGYYNNCVGHHGLISRWMMRNVFIPVRLDSDTGDIWRDPRTGFAQRVPYEVGGEILVAVNAQEDWQGYWKNPEATSKKFARDVFKKGDMYYRSGDALRRDPDGHWYFLDRLGDTFRWKSENVSTAEVALAMGRYDGIMEANVYGVTVPGHEGRAGCAALHLTDLSSINRPGYLSGLLAHCRANLPRYAVPVFLRIVKASSHIHNNKQNKNGLRQEGVDPDKVGVHEKEGANDIFFWCRPGSDTYEPFERKDWEQISSGQAKL